MLAILQSLWNKIKFGVGVLLLLDYQAFNLSVNEKRYFSSHLTNK